MGIFFQLYDQVVMLLSGHPRTCVVLLFYLCLAFLWQESSTAQESPRPLSPNDRIEQFAEGVEAYQSEDLERALTLLRPVAEGHPTLRSDTIEGTAAYWLGCVFESLSQHRNARRIWDRGVRQTAEEDTLDVHSADKYVESVFRRQGGDYERASKTYLSILSSADRDHTSKQSAIRRHVAQMQFLLPTGVRDRALRPDVDESQIGTARGGGERLVAWWRSEDPKPSTYKNERVIEHLRRVAHAESEYQSDDLTGFDERGRTYVRLGPPTEIRTIRFDSREFREVIRRVERSMANNLRVRLSEFPDNELWVYDDWGGSYPYLFVEDGEGYRVSGVTDLIPTRLRSAMDAKTGRGGAKIDVVMEAFRTALRQISVFEVGYGPEYLRIADYLGRFNEARTSRDIQGNSGPGGYGRSDNAALSAETGVGTSAGQKPDRVARKVIREVKKDDRNIGRMREKNVPNSETGILDGREEMKIVSRTARFMDEDGKTMLYTFWNSKKLKSCREESASSYLYIKKMNERYRTKNLSVKNIESGKSKVITKHGNGENKEGVFNIEYQFDKVKKAFCNKENKREIKTEVIKKDSIKFISDERKIEMSDLVPVDHDKEKGIPARLESISHPYTSRKITNGSKIAIYFEIYSNIEKGKEGVEVEYSVTAQEEGSIFSVFRDEQKTVTSVKTSIKSNERITRKYILTGIKEASLEDVETVQVSVAVQRKGDDTSVERKLSFDVE